MPVVALYLPGMDAGYYEVHCGESRWGPWAPGSTFPPLTREECKEDAIAMAEHLVAEHESQGILSEVEVIFCTGSDPSAINLSMVVWSSVAAAAVVCEPHPRSRLSPLAERLR